MKALFNIFSNIVLFALGCLGVCLGVVLGLILAFIACKLLEFIILTILTL